MIGRACAVANLFGVQVWGGPAWLVWLFVHLMYLVEFRSGCWFSSMGIPVPHLRPGGRG